MAISTEKELGEALKNNQDSIEIEGDLSRKIIKIKATGKVAWAVSIAAIGIAVALFFSSGGTAVPAAAVVGFGAVSVLGTSVATSAVAIAISAGGVGALHSLRKYKIVSKGSNKVVLSRV